MVECLASALLPDCEECLLVGCIGASFVGSPSLIEPSEVLSEDQCPYLPQLEH